MRAAALLLCLAGCAATPPPISYPPSAAERVVRLALAEWRDWGGLEREAFTGSEGIGPEAELANFPRVLAYWQAVPRNYGTIARNRLRYQTALGGYGLLPAALWSDQPWSAAFISWVFVSAGVDALEFPPSATHAYYLDSLLARAVAFPDTASFIPHAPEGYAPRPGDLICLDRSRRPMLHWTDRFADGGRPRPMHCDVAVGATPGRVQAVGGNVADAVTLTHFPADREGRLLPAPAGAPPIVLVVENRLGRLPPWSPPVR